MYSYEEIRERLAFSIPPWWQDILEARNYQDVVTNELVLLWSEVYKMKDGRFPQLATTELAKWERLLGLPVGMAGAVTWDENDNRLIQDMEGKSWDELEFDYSVRRSAVMARLRGFGRVTKQTIIDMAAQYTGGSINVIEHFGEHRITIEFTDVRGKPQGLDDLKKVIREALPAHIVIDYKFKYQTWAELNARNWTWSELNALNLTWDQFNNYES